jgi:hypothetical protein
MGISIEIILMVFFRGVKSFQRLNKGSHWFREPSILINSFQRKLGLRFLEFIGI